MIETIRQGLKEDGFDVSISKLCRWFEVSRRNGVLQAGEGRAEVAGDVRQTDQGLIEENSSFDYRTVAWLLGFNRNTVRRIFQIKGWQVRKRPVGFRPRIQALPSVASRPNERWATDLCRVWCGRDNGSTLALAVRA